MEKWLFYGHNGEEGCWNSSCEAQCDDLRGRSLRGGNAEGYRDSSVLLSYLIPSKVKRKACQSSGHLFGPDNRV